MKISIAAIAAMTAIAGGAAFAAPLSTPFKGYESYNYEEKLGWYALKQDGSTEYLWTDKAGERGIPIQSGWMRDGKLCGISSLLAEGKLYALNYVEVNEATGRTILTEGIPVASDNYLNYYLISAYNPDADRVYGYGWSESGQQYVFKSSAHDITDTQVIANVKYDAICSSLTMNTESMELIGFNRVSFVKVDMMTGEQTVIFTPEIKNFQFSYTALAYDPESGKYWWNVITKDQVSHLYSVDMEAKNIEKICDYDNMAIFSFMLPTDAQGDPTAPAKPEYASNTFTGGKLSGTVSFTLPTALGNGDKIEGELGWAATLDGVDVSNGTGAPGQTVTVDFGEVSEGIHKFGLRAFLGDKVSRLGSWTGYVGLDTPATPGNVKLDGTALSWDAVSTGANNGYIDAADVTYTVYLNGESQGTTREHSYTITYPEGATYAPYQASVTATAGGKTSEAGVSNTVKAGRALNLPVDFAPLATETFLFESTDALGGGYVWTYDDSNAGKERFLSPACDGAIDSWLFMPPVATDDPDGVYEVSVRAALLYADRADGTFEVMAGTEPTPEAMKVQVIEPLELKNIALTEFKGLFTTAGELGGAKSVYIGIRAKSANGNYRVMARRFSVKETDLKATAPAAPTGITAVAAPKGELKATVSFTLPTKRMNGEALPAGEKVKGTVQCDIMKVSAEGMPGEKVSATVESMQGENYVTVTSEAGGQKGAYGRARVYTGVAIPYHITDLNTSMPADNMTCVISWAAPTEAYGEGYLDQEKINYYYCSYNSATGQYIPEVNIGNDTSYTLKAPSNSKLTNVNFAIQAFSEAGASPQLVGNRVQLGKPYQLPMNENFWDGINGKAEFHYSPYTLITTEQYAGTSWSVSDPSEFGSKFATQPPISLVGSGETGSTGYFQFPKFSTAGLDAASLTMKVFGGADQPSAKVWGYSTEHPEPMEIGTISNRTAGYHMEGILLPAELQNSGWVTLYMTVDYPTEGNFVMKSFEITRTNAVELPAAEAVAAVIGMKGAVKISGFTGHATIVTLDGRTVWSADVEGEASAELTPGVYVTVLGEKGFKTTVK